MIITDNNRLLMDAALPLFAQNGFHKTKVSDIVKKKPELPKVRSIGISKIKKPSLYDF